MAVALIKEGREFLALIPPRGSMAASIQAALPEALVSAALHHLPASEMEKLDTPLAADVLVCSDHPQATAATVALVDSIEGLRRRRRRQSGPGGGHRGLHRGAHHRQYPPQGAHRRAVDRLRRWPPALTTCLRRDRPTNGARPTPAGSSTGDDPPPMRLYDTAQRSVVPFRPGPLVTLYSCGITPYDSAHLGHAQVYLTFDMLQRRLRDLGHETRCVRNVTDVDDDILRKARELGVHYLDLAAEEIARFDADMAALGLIPAWSEPRATSAIADILTLIGSVLDSGLRLPVGRGRLLRRHLLPRLRRGEPFRRRHHAGSGRRARRESRRSQQAPPARLRAVAAVAARRAVVGVAVGPRPSRLAHRVLGAGPS